MNEQHHSAGESWRGAEARLGWALALPALGVIALVALFPIAWTFWESLHLHDLRMPWLGRPFIGADNYIEALTDARLGSALLHTGLFVAATVTLEIAAGLVLAIALDRVARGRELVRTAVLLPWAIPTVVGALVWRFIFESPAGLASTAPAGIGIVPPTWFADATAAWVTLPSCTFSPCIRCGSASSAFFMPASARWMMKQETGS